MTGFPQIATHVVTFDSVLQKNSVTPEDEDDDDDDSGDIAMPVMPDEVSGHISAGPDDSDPPEE